MFKKEKLISLFVCFFTMLSMHAVVEKQSATFFNCDSTTILNRDALEKIVAYVMEQLEQEGAGSVCTNYTEAGYTLFQALQKGGYVNVTIENSKNKAYLDWLALKSTKSPISAMLKNVKKVLKASSHTVE